MHLLATTSATLDEIVEPVDLGQSPGDVAVLSFADSDLAGLAAAWELERDRLPSMRFAHLRDLRHPLSVDLWIDAVAAHTKVILVRLLGGQEWWSYGVERLSALARQNGIALALLPGEDRRDDPRLAEASTVPAHELDALLAFFREGGRDNLRGLLRRLARHAGGALDVAEPQPVPRLAAYWPGEGAIDLDTLLARLPGVCSGEVDAGSPTTTGARQRILPRVLIVFYRSMLLAADTAPIDALAAALAARQLAPAPLVITSLKDPAAAAFIADALAQLRPAVVVTTTAFAAAGAPGEPTPLDHAGVPVLQAVIATTKRAAWTDSARGLGASDLAMHVVLPELDGRVLAGAISFKDPLPPQAGLAFTALASRPEPDRIAALADRVAALVRLQQTPRADRRIAVLIPDYPGAPGRTGYAVGLDVPNSVLALLDDLADAGYAVSDPPATPRDLIGSLSAEGFTGCRESEERRRACGTSDVRLSIEQYAKHLMALPSPAVEKVRAAWGEPGDDPDLVDGAFCFRATWFGNVLMALAPDRGRNDSRRADYHDASLPPRHALIAFGLWLRHVASVDALVHMGAHGTLEWLPGKAVALSEACFPEIVTGPLPVIYPFIVSNPGEAAQAKRRIAAVTIGHVPPPIATSGLSGAARALEQLVDEYAQAEGLDCRRRQRLARLIVATARNGGLAGEAGLADDVDADEALRRIDAWLCDLKDLRIKDGLHVFGRATGAEAGDAAWRLSADAERAALIAALDGHRVAPGPAGSPARGRRDVLPTGRNLYTSDPRTLPTPTASELARIAADEVIRLYLQRHGEMPRALVIDLWGSATLRTGGEEIAHGLALMGCRPLWDPSTGRVTGVEVLPPAVVGRPRIDVTWRISGLFRDLFPAQITLIDAAVKAVAARPESDDENPLAAARRHPSGSMLARIFGTSPGAYGAGIEDAMGREADRAVLGAEYLAAASHAYGGADGIGTPVPGAFAARVADADLLVHLGDDPGRDLLEGSADVGFVGGFAAAAAMLGTSPDLVMLDTTDPGRPRARPLADAIARIVRQRAVNPRVIAGLMRHGPRGAAELAETVDRLVAFARTTEAVPGQLFDLVYDAYLADAEVRAFLEHENSSAAQAIAERLAAARRLGLWHPRRNDVDANLAGLTAKASS
ncbi:MAG TPA: cobaltochelatase subunit CobN [Xanthobacteraceae bacterium]|nr:cobaltochelatase subunit CobN [Xanthobacteraceae bacterium]